VDDGAPIYTINESARLLRYTPMCILLNFPSSGDPLPEPPAPSICMPQPVEPLVTNAVSVRVLPVPSDSAPLLPPLATRAIA
jgi:hypothetical protein